MGKIIFLFLSILAALNSFAVNKIIYREPLPGAKYVSINNNIIIGFEKQVHLNKQDISNCIIVTGSQSKKHFGRVSICQGGKKILFKPLEAFSINEKVTVKIEGKLLNNILPAQEEYDYYFTTSAGRIQSINTDFVKPDYTGDAGLFEPPSLSITVNNNPSQGLIFSAPWTTSTYLVISNSDGSPYWFSAPTIFGGDFKKQPNGNLTFFDGVKFKHFEMDENYNYIDSFSCGNGYTADVHELRVLNDGSAYLLAYDTEVIDMSQIVSGGNPNALVTGLIIQEIDVNKNVIFQWRSWDHFAITDATHENLLDSLIDYVHGNSIEIDTDSNLIISSRHLDEVTKINRVTGDIIWRLGGKNNQFTFLNDTLKFSHQHAVRRISNGHITLFDNGNYHNPAFSRAVEYDVNESNMTVQLVWQYRHTPSIFGSWGGYVQRLSNGNTFIAWGGIRPTVTEVNQTGNIVYEASYPLGVFTYRAYKFDWGNPVLINGNSNNNPKEFKLYQNYPNPFNPVTTLSFDLPKDIDIDLKVYDILGKEVYKIDEFRKAGLNKIYFDGNNLSSGIYYYTLSAGSFKATRKMILVK